MKSYLLRLEEKESNLWLAMRTKALRMGITVKQAIIQAIREWVKK